MKKAVKSKPKKNAIFSKILEFILYAILYTGVFAVVAKMFKTFEINGEPKILYAFIAVAIIDVLNKFLKPILITITTPIIGITFGLFYFVITAFILWLTDLIMFDLLNFTNIWILLLIALLITIFNFIVKKLIIEPIIRKASKR